MFLWKGTSSSWTSWSPSRIMPIGLKVGGCLHHEERVRVAGRLRAAVGSAHWKRAGQFLGRDLPAPVRHSSKETPQSCPWTCTLRTHRAIAWSSASGQTSVVLCQIAPCRQYLSMNTWGWYGIKVDSDVIKLSSSGLGLQSWRSSKMPLVGVWQNPLVGVWSGYLDRQQCCHIFQKYHC